MVSKTIDVGSIPAAPAKFTMEENYIPRHRKISGYLVVFICLLSGIFFMSSQILRSLVPKSESTQSSEAAESASSEDGKLTAPEKIPIAEIASTAEAPNLDGARTVYLTFDDGPGPYTAQLLDILKKYNVKVTFFVTGAGDDSLITREAAEGHTVALHTYTHDYAYVYSSISNYFTDLYEIQARVKNLTGETPTLIRFPGGSSNLISARYDGGSRIMSSLVQEVSNRGFTYFDWNVSSGDAGAPLSSDEIYQNVIDNLKPEYSVVLQHDIKDYSVNAVERIIQYGQQNGYTFKKLDASSPVVHHGVNN